KNSPQVPSNAPYNKEASKLIPDAEIMVKPTDRIRNKRPFANNTIIPEAARYDKRPTGKARIYSKRPDSSSLRVLELTNKLFMTATAIAVNNNISFAKAAPTVYLSIG